MLAHLAGRFQQRIEHRRAFLFDEFAVVEGTRRFAIGIELQTADATVVDDDPPMEQGVDIQVETRLGRLEEISHRRLRIGDCQILDDQMAVHSEVSSDDSSTLAPIEASPPVTRAQRKVGSSPKRTTKPITNKIAKRGNTYFQRMIFMRRLPNVRLARLHAANGWLDNGVTTC